MSKAKIYAQRAALGVFIISIGNAFFDNAQGSPFHNAPFVARLIGGAIISGLLAIGAAVLGGVVGY